MKIDICGDALALLLDFVKEATGPDSACLADAMWYVEEAFLVRACLLEKAVRRAVLEESFPDLF